MNDVKNYLNVIIKNGINRNEFKIISVEEKSVIKLTVSIEAGEKIKGIIGFDRETIIRLFVCTLLCYNSFEDGTV